MTLADLNEEHTHLEIDPATMLGILCRNYSIL
jgi:hypothetical protein